MKRTLWKFAQVPKDRGLDITKKQGFISIIKNRNKVEGFFDKTAIVEMEMQRCRTTADKEHYRNTHQKIDELNGIRKDLES